MNDIHTMRLGRNFNIHYSTEPQPHEENFTRITLDAEKVRQSRLDADQAGIHRLQDAITDKMALIFNSKNAPLPVPKAEVALKDGKPVLHWFTEGTTTLVAMEMGLKTFPVLVRHADLSKAAPLLAQS